MKSPTSVMQTDQFLYYEKCLTDIGNKYLKTGAKKMSMKQASKNILLVILVDNIIWNNVILNEGGRIYVKI